MPQTFRIGSNASARPALRPLGRWGWGARDARNQDRSFEGEPRCSGCDLGMPTKTKKKRNDVAPWRDEVRCSICGTDGQSCLSNYGGHEAWCFRAQGWTSSGGPYWYCPQCRTKAEEKGYIRKRYLRDAEDIREHCWCEPDDHEPRECPACSWPNWAWRKVCYNRDCRQKLTE